MIRLGTGDRVVVRLPSWLGDLVAAEPLVHALHERRARGELAGLTLVAPMRLLALLDGRFEGARRVDSRDGVAAFDGHDVAVLLDGSWRSAWRVRRAGVPARVGAMRGGRGPLLTHPFVPARERGARPFGVGRRGRRPRSLPRPFGAVCAELGAWLGLELRRTRPRLVPTAAGLEAARARRERLGLAAGEPFVLVNAASRPGSAKGWPEERWAAVCAELARRGERVLVLSAPGEEAPARAAAERARDALADCGAAATAGSTRRGGGVPRAPGEGAGVERREGAEGGPRGTGAVDLLDAPPPSLAELVALVAECALLLTADSGPRHLAVALERPHVVVCGPTDPRHTADHLERARVLRREVSCGPCHRERCPLGGAAALACMRAVEPGEVVVAAAGFSGHS